MRRAENMRDYPSIDLCSRFIKGFITRNQPSCIDNTEYLAYVRQNYLMRLKDSLPKTVLEKDSWLTPPPIMQEVSDAFFFFFFTVVTHQSCEITHLQMCLQASQLLKKLYIRHMMRKYVQGITPERKAQVHSGHVHLEGPDFRDKKA